MKNVGGQAVLEGVMMRGSTCVATSVRTSDGMIVTVSEPLVKQKGSIKKLPIIRGIVNLIDSMIIGIKVMNYSASLFEEGGEEEEDSKFYTWLNKVSNGRADKLMSYFSVGLSVVLALVMFTILPTFVAGFFRNMGVSRLGINFIEAGIKVVFFLVYLIGISKIPEIDRVFRYHGAEHKVIAAYENNLDLTVENVRKSSRYHARCGTNFLFLVLMVSIAVYSVVPFSDVVLRVVSKILLVPVVAGVTFELLRWLGASDSFLSRAISSPGKLMQKITTKEPDDQMIEVAITALKRSEGIPYTVKELKAFADDKLKNLETSALDRDVILSHVLGYDKTYIYTHPELEVTNEKFEEFKKLVFERKKHKPVSYITGMKEFMGNEFIVNEHTLIPRPDSETLVVHAETIMQNVSIIEGRSNFRILDMCSGSGAIGLSLIKLFPKAELTMVDISKEAMDVALKNAEKLGVRERTGSFISDLFEDVDIKGDFDIIVSNPPYIKSSEISTLSRDVREYEPKDALDGGDDGLDFYRKITDKSRQFLKDGGWLVFEIGYDQKEAVMGILRQFKYTEPEASEDLAGNARVVSAAYIHDL